MIRYTLNFYFSSAVFGLVIRRQRAVKMQTCPRAIWELLLWHLMGVLPFFNFLLLHLHAFSFDAENPAIYSGPEGSYFGFSVEFYLPNNDNPGILIGAPKANTTQNDVTEGGAVFLCPWKHDGRLCSIIPFDTEGDRHIVNSQEIMKDFKSKQWFGATVKAHKEQVVACAPMYHWSYVERYTSRNETGGVTPVGTCLIAVQNFSSFAEYSPCRSNILEWQIKNKAPDQRFCEAGWSSEITETGEILLGAPGSYFWQGQLIAANIKHITDNYDRNNLLSVFVYKRQTKDAKGTKDDNFEGYSLAVGEFTGDSVKEYLLGAPRAENTLGSVIILKSSDMTTQQTIVGEQVTAYFGYAVAAMDINNDGKDDILVGAPLFMSHGLDGKLHEVGRVYVYLQEQPGSFKQPAQMFTGTDKFGRFGSAIATLGDLDYDGYKDVAIGAPFAGEDGNGRVFIYLGHVTGLHPKSYQELKGTWLPDVVSAGFGFSLRGGSDIDANNYPDLLVGAHDVDKVLLYRARPVIRAEAQIKLMPDILNPELKTCNSPQLSNSVTCFEVQACVTVEGHGIAQYFALNAQVELDKNKQRSQRRTLFLHSHQAQESFQFLSVRNKETACRNFTAYLRHEAEFKDKLSPIVVTLNCSLSEQQRLSSGSLTSVLSPHSRVMVTEKTRILRDCGSDNVCVPDLRLNATADKNYLIAGDLNPLTVIINAGNHGEGAYETELHIPMPPQIDFINIVQNNKHLTKLSCNPKVENDTQTVVCDLGNPMKQGLELSAGLHFTVHSLEQVESVTFSMQIKSKNSQNSHSEVVFLKFHVQVMAQLVLRGASLPEQILLPYIDLESPADFVVKNETLPIVEHVYELHNNGPSAISDAILEVDWPADFHGNGLLFKSKIIPWGRINCTVNSSDAENWVQPLTTMSPLPNVTEDSRHDINKRDVNKPENSVEETIFDMNCNTVTCVKIMCRVGLLEKEKSAAINIQSHLTMEIFVQNRNKQFTFQSGASFIVQEMPYRVQPVVFPSGTKMVQTLIERGSPEVASPVPIWCIVVAVLGGLLLVALVAFLLWKCGFFKRKLPPTEEEGLL
ncbi:integrin alpha-8-like [Heterodontus francisci]|uniref:integrin alpha-8-like n=1 Tax=Heterodontus francisci TaxID=7792 RepID=UPI00355C10E8